MERCSSPLSANDSQVRDLFHKNLCKRSQSAIWGILAATPAPTIKMIPARASQGGGTLTIAVGETNPYFNRLKERVMSSAAAAVVEEESATTAAATAAAVKKAAQQHPSGDNRFKILEATMKRHQYQADALIEVLHTAQELFGHLDTDLLYHIAHSLKVPLSRIYGVATFYHFFSLAPKGRHT
jgi:hypothetical protein